LVRHGTPNKVPAVIDPFQSLVATVGGTPTVRLGRLARPGSAEIHLKLEQLNPGASAKDRVAGALLERSLASGNAPSAGVVVGSSGSLGISLAMVCAARGIGLTVVLPDSATLERRAVLRLYGVRVELTAAEGGLAEAQRRARAVAEATGAVLVERGDAPEAERAVAEGLGRELVETARANGGADAFVCGVGSGATLTSAGRSLKDAFPSLCVVAVEASASPALSKGAFRPHRIQGLSEQAGAPCLDRSLVQRVIAVTDAEARSVQQRLAREEGLLVGISTGANVRASQIMAEDLGEGRRVYTLAMDSGERYFSLAEQFA
jgi:cysteine synthase A